MQRLAIPLVILLGLAETRAVGQTAIFNAGAASAAAGSAASSAVAGANGAVSGITATAATGVAPPPNLWDFLGVPQMFRGGARLAARVRHRVNRLLPFGKKLAPLDAPPPGMASPAAGGAAEMQKVEANAEVNVQAIAYLGNFGCSDCFPDIEKAIYHALQDCMPGPRLAALKVVNARGGSCCTHCASNSCCSLRIREALHDIAYGVDELGCPKVTDPKQLRLAREALRKCSCVALKVATPPTNNTEAVPEMLPLPANDDPLETSQYTVPFVPDALDGRSATNIEMANHQQSDSIPSAALELLLAEVGQRPIRVVHLLTPDERRSMAPSRQVMRDRLEGMINFQAVTAQAIQVGFVPAPDESGRISQPGERQFAQAYLAQLTEFDEVVTDQEAFRYFEANQRLFVQPPTLVWEQLTVPIRYFASAQHAYRVAEYLRGQAVGGRDMPKAPEFRDHDYIVEVSDPTPEHEIAPESLERLRGLRENEVSEVHREGDKFRVYALQRRLPERPGTFAEMHEDIVARIRHERQYAAQTRALHQIRMNAAIWVVPDIDTSLNQIAARTLTATHATPVVR